MAKVHKSFTLSKPAFEKLKEESARRGASISKCASDMLEERLSNLDIQNHFDEEVGEIHEKLDRILKAVEVT